MTNAKSNAVQRLLAAFLSMLMVLSIIPFSIVANASTTTHPDKVTVTVVDDETNEPIKDAKVSFTIYDNDANSIVVGGTDEPTDENGEVAVLDAVSGNISISEITVSHADYETYSNEAYNQPIKSLDDNFIIKLTCKKIRDVEISGKTLPYTGDAQELVSVTEVEGDTVMYELDGGVPTSVRPMATDVGTYNIKVTVIRAGKENLEKDVTTTIEPAETGINITPKTGLKYNGSEQELVEIDGLEENDVVTWEINGVEENSHDVPKRMAVGKYTIKLTVNRGSNYKVFAPEPIEVEIALGEINLGDLKITANDRTYDTTTQPLLNTPENVGDYTLKYSEDRQAWSEAIPEKADAGEYQVWVKASKDNYEDKDTPYFPITVTIKKAAQALQFVDDVPADITLGANNEYNFAAKGENLSGNDIEYSLIDRTAADVATISAEGKVVVEKAGIVTVKVFRAGNDNYHDAVVYKTIVVKNASDELVAFDSDSENYVLDEGGVVSEKSAAKTNGNDNGSLIYSIDNTNIGLAISADGKITVKNEWELERAMRKTGSVLVTVTVSKAEGSVDGIEWVYENGTWKAQNITRMIYASDTDTYTVLITYSESPAFDEVCNIKDPDPISGWYNAKYPATITPKDTEKYTIALDEVHWNQFGESVTIEEQGIATHCVYLKDKSTGQVSGPISKNVKVDTVKPEADRIKIEYAKSPMDSFLETITLGIYNPSVTVRFTAYDTTSGIDYFTWNYTKETNASTINHPETKTGKVAAVRDESDKTKYTAEFTITADEENQYRGSLAVTATDKANNVSGTKNDTGNIFVIDTVSPEIRIKFAGKESDISEIDSIGNTHYFNGDVEVELTITEANFDSEYITVLVSKDGEAYDYGSIEWGHRNALDETVGKFTLAGDGDYVVTVKATDKSHKDDPKAVVTYESDIITVDTLPPTIDSVYDPVKQNITLTITEHNFRASDIRVDVKALDIKGDSVAVKDIQAYVQNQSNWSSDGDVHTLVLESTEENKLLVDAIYELKIDYSDISDNSAETEITESALIDHTAPDVSKIKIEYSTSIVDTVLSAITLGFYNPSVEVTFTAYDNTAGVVEFDWYYDRQEAVSEVNLKDDSGKLTEITRNGDEATAKLILPLKEAEQLRGHISVEAVDKKGNKSLKKTDNDKVIVVDTVGPKMTVEYSTASNSVDTRKYYTGDVEVTFTVTEANFFSEDVKVSVSKDGIAAKPAAVVWKDESADLHIGKLTLSGDGDYVVYVEYKDRSDNFMSDDNGNVIGYTDGDVEIRKYKSGIITIDTIDPVIEVTYDDDKVAAVNTLVDRDGNNRKYYSDTKTATITITEHNFNADDVKWNIIAKDVAGNILAINDLHSKSSWSTNGDVHTLTITYPGDANYTFDMAYTDLATREAVAPETAYFTVDKTAPINLTVDYSTSILDTVLESLSFGFYNAKMTVTLTAEDPTSEVHSFLYSYLNAAGVSSVNAELINEAIDAADIKYSADRKTATVTFEIPKLVLGNDNQFNGTVEFTAIDRAGNTTDTHKETKRIVVDNIAPTAQVSYNEATNVVGDISYYNGDITATVTVNEANFYAGDVQVMVSKDGGAATAVTPTWKDNSVDIHIGTFTITGDGDYVVTINYTDKSSNKMVTYTSKQMTVDTKIEAPAYTINGVAKTEVGGAYKGDATIGFSFNDQNFDTKNITLTRTRFDKVEDVTAEFVKVNDNNKGGSGSFSIPSEVDNDGIYVLKISMTDKAKHQTESQVKFTINRFGSVYEYSDKLVDLIKDGGQYVTSVKDDLVITEYNADRILEGSLKILITRDGESVDVDFTSNPETINAQVGIGESGWYQYVYTIKASNFEKDGVYKITLTSKYAADDSAENESTSVPDNSIDSQGKAIVDSMNFTVDSVAPEIRNIVNLDKRIADRDKIVDGKLNVKYTVVDVGGLKSIEITVNGKTVQTLTENEIADNAYNFTGSFDIGEQNGTTAQKVRIKVTDLAGNVTDTDSDDFLKAHSEDNENSTYVFHNEITVSRNFFVRWYANPVLFWGSIGGVIVLAGIVCFLIAAKKKKQSEAK